MAPKINLKDKVEDGEMDLSLCDLQDVPVKDIATFKKIHALDVSNNHLTILPKNFASLTNLVKLDLSKNSLKELPDNFGDLTKLKHLDLYKNQLQHLPLSFNKLKSLRWLDLKDNQLVPLIKDAAGPCLDSKQCQSCAKDIIAFYCKLQDKVDKEREVREKQRQKVKEAQLQAVQKLKMQEKKSKKTQKKKSKENSVAATSNGQISAKTEKNSAKLKEKDSESPSALFVFKQLFVSAFMVVLVLFLSTASKVQYMESVEETVVAMWNSCLQVLPQHMQAIGLQIGEFVRDCHEATATGIVHFAEFTAQLKSNSCICNVFKEIRLAFDNSMTKLHDIYDLYIGGSKSHN